MSLKYHARLIRAVRQSFLVALLSTVVVFLLSPESCLSYSLYIYFPLFLSPSTRSRVARGWEARRKRTLSPRGSTSNYLVYSERPNHSSRALCLPAASVRLIFIPPFFRMLFFLSTFPVLCRSVISCFTSSLSRLTFLFMACPT